MPRHNENEIQRGLALFKKVCHRTKQSRDKFGQLKWSGHTCDGDHWTIKHVMFEDRMTQEAVCETLGLHSILKPARAHYNKTLQQGIDSFMGTTAFCVMCGADNDQPDSNTCNKCVAEMNI